MKSRLLVAAIGVPTVAVIVLLLPSIATAVMVALLSAVAAHELTTATGLVKNPRITVETMLMAALVPFWAWAGSPALPAMIAVVVFTLVLASELLASKLSLSFETMTACLFGGLLSPWLLSSLVRLVVQEDGRFLVVVPILVAFVADGAALFAGMAFGKHKLAPVISPKKTIEGMLGGFAGAVLCMVLYCVILQFGFGREVSYLSAVLVALCGAAVSVVGDLFFSCLKREKQIKDFGKLLPGHGGVLDRFDSMYFCAPVCELLLLLLPLLP